MTSPERDYDDILRRALRAAAESVEPAADGLDRIRGRVSARRASPFVLLTEFLDWFRPILLGLESGTQGVRSGLLALATRMQLRARTGPVLGRFRPALARLRARLRPLVAWTTPLLAAMGWKAPREPRAAHRNRTQPSPTGLRARLGPAFTRLGPAASWLRPVIAVAGAVGIVVAGVFALGQAQQFITPTNQVSRPAATHHNPSAPATSPTVNAPPVVQPVPTFHPGSSLGSAAAASCPPSPKPTKSTTPAPSTTPPPPPTHSATPTPTPTVSTTPTPTPTITSLNSAGASAGQVATTRAKQLPALPCSPATRASSKAT